MFYKKWREIKAVHNIPVGVCLWCHKMLYGWGLCSNSVIFVFYNFSNNIFVNKYLKCIAFRLCNLQKMVPSMFIGMQKWFLCMLDANTPTRRKDVLLMDMFALLWQTEVNLPKYVFPFHVLQFISYLYG